MRLNVAGVAAAISAVLIQLVEQTTSAFVDELRTGDAIGWLPQLESTGWTASLYSYTSLFVMFLLAVPLMALLGYWVGQSLDVSQAYPRIFKTFAVGGGVGFIAAAVLIGPSIYFVEGLVIVAGFSAATGIRFAFVGVAGAALAEFGVGSISGQQPMDGSTGEVEDYSD